MTTSAVHRLTNTIPSPVIAIFSYAIATGYSTSVLPLIIPEGVLSASLFTGWLTAIFYTGMISGTLSSNILILRLGHKTSFITLQLCLSFILLLLPVFTNQYFWLLDRAICGFLVGGIFVTIESWLLKGSDDRKRKRLSIYMCALYAGTTLGQLALSVFGAAGNTPFTLSAIALILAAITLVILPDYKSETHFVSSSIPTITSFHHWVKTPALTGCFISGILLGSVYGVMPFQLQTMGMSQKQIGLMMAVIIIGAITVQPVISILSKKVGGTLLISFFSLLGAMSIALSEQYLNYLFIGMFLLGMAVFALYPISINLGSSDFSENDMVGASQQMLLTCSAGSIFGPLIAQKFISSQYGIFGLFFIILITTSIYMLLVSIKGISRIAIHK
ncbi:MFS transporter [Vibrio salinus]|uniref:MFS transporter n=1 Tax=Vibrio salinus TaxID=2899784 RepID=UPI001E5204A1|nr:MFS transporter [Vibrio salinus]MCE0495865.1 MFS transporter [Vibrio salinus]